MFTYDLSTTVGQLRLRLSDTEQSQAIFSDEELAVFLMIEGSVFKQAAALALETLATNQALLLKKLRTLSIETDGPELARSLRADAAELRRQAAADLAAADGATWTFDIWHPDL